MKKSREQLEQVIQAWSMVIRLEEFFRSVQDRAQPLPESERRDVLERLRLAREFVGTQGPLRFLPCMEDARRALRAASPAATRDAAHTG